MTQPTETPVTDEKPKCNCACIDCIEGNHCGGEFWWPTEEVDGQEPQLVGKCEYIPDDWIEEVTREDDDDEDFDDYEHDDWTAED